MLDWKRTLLVVAICFNAGGCGSHDHDHGEVLGHDHAGPIAVVDDGSKAEPIVRPDGQ